MVGKCLNLKAANRQVPVLATGLMFAFVACFYCAETKFVRQMYGFHLVPAGLSMGALEQRNFINTVDPRSRSTWKKSCIDSLNCLWRISKG